MYEIKDLQAEGSRTKEVILGKKRITITCVLSFGDGRVTPDGLA